MAWLDSKCQPHPTPQLLQTQLTETQLKELLKMAIFEWVQNALAS